MVQAEGGVSGAASRDGAVGEADGGWRPEASAEMGEEMHTLLQRSRGRCARHVQVPGI